MKTKVAVDQLDEETAIPEPNVEAVVDRRVPVKVTSRAVRANKRWTTGSGLSDAAPSMRRAVARTDSSCRILAGLLEGAAGEKGTAHRETGELLESLRRGPA